MFERICVLSLKWVANLGTFRLFCWNDRPPFMEFNRNITTFEAWILPKLFDFSKSRLSQSAKHFGKIIRILIRKMCPKLFCPSFCTQILSKETSPNAWNYQIKHENELCDLSLKKWGQQKYRKIENEQFFEIVFAPLIGYIISGNFVRAERAFLEFFGFLKRNISRAGIQFIQILLEAITRCKKARGYVLLCLVA